MASNLRAMTSNLCTLFYSGFLNLGWRVAPHSVPYTISQVCLALCQPGMSPQSASRGPVERVYVAVSLALET